MSKFTCLLLTLSLTTCIHICEAVELPAGIAQSVYATGLAATTHMVFAPDGRLFVSEQIGKLRIIKDGVLLPEPFMTLPVAFDAERGLKGVAFDPNFAANNYIYVFYSVGGTMKNRVSRFTANGDLVVPGTEKKLLEWEAPRSANHHGGDLQFGTDGNLYISTGDNSNPNEAQSLNSLLGKILRIKTDGMIPTDNPFYATASGDNRAIWYYGLRNPFTFSIEKTSGLGIINDVGETRWEEVNVSFPAGANYGWPTTEGPTTDSRFAPPIFAYQHAGGDPTGCSVIGGAFYNTAVRNLPDKYYGKYFFGDWCGGWIRTLDQPTGTVELFATGIVTSPLGPTNFDFGPDGALYFVASSEGPAGTGTVFRIAIAGDRPAITAQPVSKTVTVGQPASFSVGASGSAPLAYQWRKNGVNIPGATLASYTLASTTLADNGARFSAVVSNTFGSITSNEAILTVTTNVAPTPTILTPLDGTLYTAGSTISYSGDATDPEQGTLPASAFSWEVVFHHDTHTHPFMPATSGSKSGSFVIPTIGETASTVWYRIYLTVTDSGALPTTVYRDILPRKANITLASNPSGLQVTLDGQPKTTPYTVTGVVGMIRQLGLTSPQTQNGIQYTFKSWSDGQTASHDIVTPATDTTYTATFEVSSLPVPVIGVESISPFIGSGTVQTFTAVYSSSNGWLDIGFAYFMINAVVSPNNSCYVEYNRAANTLRLISEFGTSWLGPITPGSTGSLQNSACILNGPGSSASGSGNNLSVNLSITFRSTFVGKRGIFLSAQDNQGRSIDWSPYGAWWPNQISGSLTNWYRLYVPSIHSHHYTTDLNEYNTLATLGFVQEGSSGRMFNALASASGVAAIPLYRIYIAPSGDHFWTPDRNEYLTLIKVRGYYVGEGVDGLLFSQPVPGTIPLYRLLYNFALPPIHHWTTDQNEYDTLRTRGDWTGEGITGYMYAKEGSTGLSEHVEVTSSGERGKAALGEKRAAADAGASGIVGVLNSGSKRPAPIVPGESIMLMGYGISAEDADNLTVSIEGQPARVLDVSDNHVRVLVPRAIAGHGEVTVEITVNGRKYEPVRVELAGANPGIYVENPFGMGQAVIRNADGTDNSVSNPAEKGSLVTLYITGEGDVHPVTVSIGGYPAQVVDVTPSAYEGRTAVRIVVPDVPETLYPLAIGLQAGEAMAQQGATIAVK